MERPCDWKEFQVGLVTVEVMAAVLNKIKLIRLIRLDLELFGLHPVSADPCPRIYPQTHANI